MADIRYLALLRGINVGGKNIIKMTDLKACFESMGFSDAATYIQSGNVLFKSAEKDKDKLTNKIEKELSKRFSYASRVVTVTHAELEKIVRDAPRGFGKEMKKFRYDVIFLKEPLTPKEAMENVSTKEGVDTAHAGEHALYFSRLISKASQSHLPRIISLPVYQYMTIRNWNTTTKLLSLMEKGSCMKSGKAGFDSVDEYIATLPEERRKKLEELRATIKAAAPGAREKISYQIGALELNSKNLVHFAGWKNHIAMYPIPSGSQAFNKEVSKYSDGKGTLKIPLDKPLPLKLITRVVKYRIADNLKKARMKSGKGK